MIKRITLIAISLVMISCGEVERVAYKNGTECASDTMDARSKFILECIKNANPKSDEEPEDWIYMCKRMAVDTFCYDKQIKIKQCRGTIFGISHGSFAQWKCN